MKISDGLWRFACGDVSFLDDELCEYECFAELPLFWFGNLLKYRWWWLLSMRVLLNCPYSGLAWFAFVTESWVCTLPAASLLVQSFKGSSSSSASQPPNTPFQILNTKYSITNTKYKVRQTNYTIPSASPPIFTKVDSECMYWSFIPPKLWLYKELVIRQFALHMKQVLINQTTVHIPLSKRLTFTERSCHLLNMTIHIQWTCL